MIPAVATEGLSRSYGESRAVDDLSLTVEAGEIYGLLGPNGAGKTTTLRMLTTLLRPTGGRATVCGFDVSTQGDEVRRRVGFVMQQLAVRYLVTGRESVEVEAALLHVPRREVKKRAAEVLELLGLTSAADRLVATYSGGMQKRIDLACGLLHRPSVLVLDEPTLGLDVQSRHHIWEHIKQLREEGVTILLATNYLDEADRLCDRLTIIDHGREVVTGSPSDLKRAVAAEVVQVQTGNGDEFREVVGGESWVQRVVGSDGYVHVYVDDASVAIPTILRLSLERGVQLNRVAYTQPSLDDVFLLHTGRELREEANA